MNDVPDMGMGGRGVAAPPGAVHFSNAIEARTAFTAVPPPQQMGPTRDGSGRKQRVTGLVPAQAGYTFPLVLRDRPTERVSPREIARLKGEIRRAEAAQRAAESAWVESVTLHGAASEDAKGKLDVARKALDAAAILKRRLAEAEQSAVGRPTQVHLALVREPSEVPDALANADTPPVVVCMHDGCKHERWEDEASMRRAHPTNQEMHRTQQAHVWAYLSEAPIDAVDPEGPIVGYIAPIGRDGTTVQAASEGPMGADDVESLRVELAEQGRRLAEALAAIEALQAKKK